MVNNESLEMRIKSELKQKGNEIEPSDELYSKIMAGVNYKKGDNSSMFKNRMFRMSKKGFAAALLCLTIGAGIISFSASSSLRALAADTVSKIKTIFVLDGTGKDAKVVEEPVNKVVLSTMVSKSTSLSNDALTEKLGFKVSLPDILENGFKLKDKAETLGLQKIDYNTGLTLQGTMHDAIDNEASFKSLLAYDPIRGVGANYSKDTKEIFIAIAPNKFDIDEMVKAIDHIKLDIAGSTGYWLNLNIPVYPTKIINGISTTDMTQKPTEIKTVHSLVWISDGIRYEIVFNSDNELSMDETAAIAKAYMSQLNK